MKTFIKKSGVIFLWVLFFLIPTCSYGQSVLEITGDTVVVIGPKQVATINCIIEDLKGKEGDLRLLNEIISEQERLLSDKDSIIKEQSIMQYKTETYYLTVVDEMHVQLEIEKRKRKRERKIFGVIGIVLASLVIIN